MSKKHSTRNNERYRQLTEATLAKNTKLAYASDLKDFLRSGGKIPATPEMLITYLMECGGWFAYSTIKRRLISIKKAHQEQKYFSPTEDPKVKALLRGIKRKYGCAQRQAKPVTRDNLRCIVSTLDNSARDARDKAILLLGFAGAFRRSELVFLDVEDIEIISEGLLINLRRSKTDQEQRGRMVAIPKVRSRLCAVRALIQWLKIADIQDGAIFQSLSKSGTPTGKRLDAGHVSSLLKRKIGEIGKDAKKYSAHSLRAGLVTEAAKAGVSSWKIRQQTGHKTEAALARYIRDVNIWDGNAAVAASSGRN